MTSETKSVSFLTAYTRKLCLEYLEALGGPVALGISIALRYNDDITACSHSIEPSSYEDVKSFARDYLASKFLSKFEQGPIDLADTRKRKAVEKFLACEEHLKTKHTEFNSVISGLNSPDLCDMLYIAKEKLSQIIGPVRDAFQISNCRFGPGSSSSVPRSQAHPSQKYEARDLSQSCYPFVRNFFLALGLEEPDPQGLNFIDHSSVQVVPKNFTADRVIAIEPDWNIMFQKMFGAYIRFRLRLFGIDLNRGASRNAKLCLQGSITGLLATVDLSSASDLVATFLVRFLLPEEWFAVLNSVRTTSIQMAKDETPIHLRKFSSMGNGFTFELESLIYYSLTYAVARYNQQPTAEISVFGDDIICPRAIMPDLERLFSVVGFKMNLDKSCLTGYFRESCGSHYFKGVGVKPFYLRENVTNDITKFKFCNSIREVAARIDYQLLADSRFLHVYNTCKSSIRRIFYIPSNCGDGGLVSSFDEVHPSVSRKRKPNIRKNSFGIEGYKVKCLLPVTVERSSTTRGMLIHKLRTLEDIVNYDRLAQVRPKPFLEWMRQEDERSSTWGNDYPISPRKVGYRVSHIRVRQWEDPVIY